jgi:AbiU2
VKTEEAEERLRSYLHNGLAMEILWADRSYTLAEEIGRHAEHINAASFGELFGPLQLVLSERHTLAIVKIFDPVKQYPTRSIPGTLALMESNAQLWRVYERQRIHEMLAEAGLDSSHVEGMSNAELTHATVAHYRATLPDPKRLNPDNLSFSLNKLRQSRDKAIAHNEAIESSALQVSTWGEANSLVRYAKEFVSTVEKGYLGLSRDEGSGDYIFANDSRRTSIALRRLLKEAGIVADIRC